MSEAKFEPGEGLLMSGVDPSPALALLGHPLPQGERETEFAARDPRFAA